MKRFIETLQNIWKIEDLRKRLITTILFVMVYRFGSYIVLPGINPANLEALQNQTSGGLLGLLDMLESDAQKGIFEFRPLEPGFGITIGNALRRILLSSLEGFAITSIKIDGVEHEFATVPGVMEDVTNIILNLKKVRFKRCVDDVENEKVSITVSGKNTFTAGDIGRYLTGFVVLNPDLLICRIDPNYTMQIDLTINKGRGYVPAEENKVAGSEVDVIPIDAIFTPIVNVKYAIENYRLEQKTDYEKLVFEVSTDGSINPKDALRESAKILIQHFMPKINIWH